MYDAFNDSRYHFESQKQFMIKLSCELCHDYCIEKYKSSPSDLFNLLSYGIISEEEYIRLTVVKSYENEFVFFRSPCIIDYFPNDFNSFPKTNICFRNIMKSKVYCSVCKELNNLNKIRTDSCCVCCKKSVCCKHGLLICVGCLNYYISLKSNK